MTTSIIGLGKIGSRLATNFVNGGESILIADNTFAKAQELAQTLGSLAQPRQITEAIAEADVIILSIWFDDIKEFFKTYTNQLAGKILVDPSNPLGPDGQGGFKKNIPTDQSSGGILSTLVPTGAKLVKAFGTLGANSLGNTAFREPERTVLFYAADDEAAGQQVAKLITASGFDPVFVGGLDQSIRIEVGGDLHEFGKLGKTVTKADLASKI
ncbi:NADP oxidoreductase coenzyme F420-dependent [Acinetobacter oleivorans]|uniref:NADPH-dependent F420 reductase n=1 Tax=Acinetobacter oleivorans TaxID=1148157 RepID=UPI000D2FB6F6|nr:NAD(P)-binding domain-containing protein [Acinetobacter oleivorans]PTV48026.1 NADP oxidoreductase coenzyme F420-dependent [Acinetobacter oleivorans]